MQQIEMPDTITFYQGGKWITMKQSEYETHIDNERKSEREVEDWKKDPPDKYFLYINEEEETAGTWMGDILGVVTFGREYRSNFGDKRVPIDVYGNNGVKYYGTYYKSAGDYARIRRYK